MKNHLIRIVLGVACLFFAMQNIEAQRFIGSVAAGVNFAQIEGDGVHGFYKVGFNGGLGLTLPVNQKQTWQVSLELLYSQKGSLKKCIPGSFDTTRYAPSMYLDVDRTVPWDSTIKCKMALDYVQIPLMVRYEEPNSGCTFALGFAWGRLVRAKEIYNGFTRTTSARSGTFKKSDWSVIADINFSRLHGIGDESSKTRYHYEGIIRKWAALGAKQGNEFVYRPYSWNLAENWLPYSKLAIWGRELPFFHKMGVRRFNLNYTIGWNINAPHNYLALRMAWDTSLDWRKVLDDFCRAAYGPAAATMARYHLAIDTRQRESGQEAGAIWSFPLMSAVALLYASANPRSSLRI